MRNITYISAGAGSGKTYTLTTKLAQLISKDKTDPEHVEPEQVILTTFTNKAANEFKERAKAELYKMGKYDEAARLDHAMMGTIDSVASQLIQKYWYTIGLSPKQGVMDDEAKTTYINQSIADIPTDEDLRLFARFRKAFGVVDANSRPDDNFWKEHLKVIVEKSISFDITDYQQSEEHSLCILKILCDGKHIHLESGQRTAVTEALYNATLNCKDSNKKTKTLNAADALQKRGSYMDDIEWCIEFGKALKDAPAAVLKDTGIGILEDAKQRMADLWRSQEVYDLQEAYIKTVFRLAKEWNEQYTEYKRNKRIVDFSDIEHYMHQLLQDPVVAAEIGRTYTHLFVDEFQDCSPIQVKVFMALAGVVKQSYWVGDTKQAIYGFRGSDTQLTKAVADAISRKEKADGCLTETLGESWRSVPALVDASNKAFIEIFQPLFGEQTQAQVELKSAMELHPEKFEERLVHPVDLPLRYLNINEKRSQRSSKLRVDDIAWYIKQVIEKEGAQPSDIAVLARNNASLDDVQDALKSLRIPFDREKTLDKDCKASQLMMALTALTVNPQDDLAKAEIAFLTQDHMGVGAIIDSKLEYNNTPKDKRMPWLSDTEMVRRVNAIRPRVMYQGIGAMMETLAVELDVKNVFERWTEPTDECMNDVKALITAAKAYEDRSGQLAQPATPAGFQQFITDNEVKIPTVGEGVLLSTIHGSKGLEWKYVLLLLDETLDAKKILSREFYGINHFHLEEPTADNLYPSMTIRLLPWIFGSRHSNVPDTISQQIMATDNFAQLRKHSMEESARLLYVGMTRASDALVLVPWTSGKELDWFVQLGLENASATNGSDVLGIGVPFAIVSGEPENADTFVAEAPVVCRQLDYYAGQPSEASFRSLAPSSVRSRADEVRVVLRSEQFITIQSSRLGGRDYSEVGDCIHNVFAAIDHLDETEVAQLILSHGMDLVLPHAAEVVRAWGVLQSFLRKEYGAPVAEYHERPFQLLKANGQLMTGSIDYVYRTEQGVVLIDFKTFPQVEAVTDPASSHYAGWYGGQLDAYTEALEAAGERVISRYIYYPVSGMLVEVGRSQAPDDGLADEQPLSRMG